MALKIDSSFSLLIREIEREIEPEAQTTVAVAAKLQLPPVPSSEPRASAHEQRAKDRGQDASEARRIAGGCHVASDAVLSGRLGSATFRSELRSALKDAGLSLADVIGTVQGAQRTAFAVAMCEGSTKAEREGLLGALERLADVHTPTLESEAARTAMLRIAFFPTHGEQLVGALNARLFSAADIEEYRRESASA